MNKQVNPNVAAIVLIGIAVVLLVLLPVSIKIEPNTTTAEQATVVNAAQQGGGHLVEYTLKTIIGQTPPMAFIGVGGEIDGQINPHLTANVGDTVRITVINGDPVLHNMVIDEFGVETGDLVAQDQQGAVEFVPDHPGDFMYYCSQPGHRQVGMFGTLTVTGEALASYVAAPPTTLTVAAVPTAAPAAADAVSVVRNPADLPAPVGDRGPTNVRVDLHAVEVNGLLADGTTYRYFTFDGKVPGPMIRVRVGDTVELHVHNDTTSQMAHSIDLHAVNGPGGGAVYTQTNPGRGNRFQLQGALARRVRLSLCHAERCRAYRQRHVRADRSRTRRWTAPVDREFYVMQSEVYTAQPFGTTGNLTFDYQAMLDERPQYFVFNGASMALTSDENALRANVGDTVRIFFGVGGPNFTSAFHVIGEQFDRVYNLGSLTTPPMTDVQTIVVPPGDGAMVEFKVNVPGRYILVDHALSRLERGLAGYLYVDGPDQPDIFQQIPITPGS